MYHKKHLGIIILIMFVFGFGASHVKANQENPLEPLLKFQDFFEKEGIALAEWQVMIREHIQVDDPENFIEKLFNEKAVHTETSTHSIKYFTQNTHKNAGIHEQISIVQEKENPGSLQVFYVIKGNYFSTQVEKTILNNIFRAKSQFFTKNPSIFTCVIGNSNDNINSKIITKNFQKQFNMKILKTLNEPNFSTVSGFIPQLNGDRIPVSEDEQMNVQLAVRNVADQSTTITLGTPILTVEY